jgi:site-specific recombinase XerD
MENRLFKGDHNRNKCQAFQLIRVFGTHRHFHALKHSIATHLLDAGADLRFVQDWIGHASIGNTVIYAQLTSRRRDEQARKVFASQYIV